MCSSAPAVLKTAPLSTDAQLAQYVGEGPWYGCLSDSIVAPRVAQTGLAGSQECPPTTIPALFKTVAQKKGSKDALLIERPLAPLENGRAPPALPRSEWMTWSFAKYHNEVRAMAKGLIDLKFAPFDSVNIWGHNSPEWFIAAQAGMYAGGKVAGLYPTDTPEGAAYKVVHSAGSIVVLEDKGKLDKLVKALSDRGDCKHLKAFIVWTYEPAPGETVEIEGLGPVGVHGWQSVQNTKTVTDEQLDKVADAINPGSCCSLIYTSGTTGDPKAVMISHDSFIYEASALGGTLSKSKGWCAAEVEERMMSYLPLSHVAGMLVDIIVQIVCSSKLPGWNTVFFARPYDLKIGTIKDRLNIAKPTIFLGVPLVWEKMADKIKAIGAEASPILQKFSGWAKGLSIEYAKDLQIGGEPSTPWGWAIASKLMKTVRGRLGFDVLKYACTGAAPIRSETVEYYGSLQLYLNELYGMSECCGAVTLSTDECHQLGSCGYALQGCEVKAFIVDPTDMNKKKECPRAPDLTSTSEEFQGELCYRGRNVMMGYLACKDFGDEHIAEIQQKTAESIDKDGWLHSGDKGLISNLGMVKITGRYKELIIGEGGENIAPVPIEDNVKEQVAGINEIMMIGDKRKYNVALVTLKAVGASGDTPGTDKLDAGAKLVNPSVTLISEAMKDPKWIETITNAIKATNANQKICLNNTFKIQKFTILPLNFSEEANELTPTKKLKRKVVENKYKDLIDKMYSTDGMYIPFN